MGRPELAVSGEMSAIERTGAPCPRLLWIDVDKLVGHPTEAEPLGDLEQLTSSVRACGILQPLLVEPAPAGAGRWHILDGHHRAEVARRVGLRRVPCTVSLGVDAEVVTLASNVVRRTMPPVQQARAFGRLRGRGLTLTQIAARTGYTEGHISGRLALLDLDEATLARVEDGRIGADQATAAVRHVRRGGGVGGRRPAAVHFGPGHRLAGAAADRCADQHGRRAPGRLGGVACGLCWEHAIRADCAQPPAPLPHPQHHRPPPPGPRPAPTAAVSHHDEVMVRQAQAGSPTGGLSRADRLELARRADSPAHLAELLGLTWDAAARLIHSADRLTTTGAATGAAV